MPTNFDFARENYRVYTCTPMSYAGSAPPRGLISAPDQPSQVLVHCDFEIFEGSRDRVAWGALRVLRRGYGVGSNF
jgi:hypothetical protein